MNIYSIEKYYFQLIHFFHLLSAWYTSTSVSAISSSRPKRKFSNGRQIKTIVSAIICITSNFCSRFFWLGNEKWWRESRSGWKHEWMSGFDNCSNFFFHYFRHRNSTGALSCWKNTFYLARSRRFSILLGRTVRLQFVFLKCLDVKSDRHCHENSAKSASYFWSALYRNAAPILAILLKISLSNWKRCVIGHACFYKSAQFSSIDHSSLILSIISTSVKVPNHDHHTYKLDLFYTHSPN